MTAPRKRIAKRPPALASEIAGMTGRLVEMQIVRGDWQAAHAQIDQARAELAAMQPSELTLDSSLAALDLSNRLVNWLEQHGCFTWGDVARLDGESLLDMPRFERQWLDVLRDGLRRIVTEREPT